MENILMKLKAVLNGLTDNELKQMDLWVDNSTNIEIIAIDENSISLITDKSKLKIDGMNW